MTERDHVLGIVVCGTFISLLLCSGRASLSSFLSGYFLE
jgi:hypothetical protein